MEVIKPASNLATNQKVFSLITDGPILEERLLEIGAGRGYMARRLGEHIKERGGEPQDILTACDLLPEQFRYEDIPCDSFDFVNALPYEDNSYDTVFAIELIEHLESPVDFIKEAYRVLRPGGRFIFSTPNVLNVNSRLSYLACGFFILFGPVSQNKADSWSPAGHIMPLSYYYLDAFMRRVGFRHVEFHADRIKRSAVLGCLCLAPLIAVASLLKSKRTRQKHPEVFEKSKEQIKLMNSFRVLCSRSCILVGHKP